MNDPAPFAPIIAVVGPSGVGKDSVMAALAARDPGFRIQRRVITRPEDAGGEAFTGVTPEVFAQMAAAGAFALHWQAHGLSYGIPVEVYDLRRGARAVLVNLSRGVLRAAQDRFGSLIVLSLIAAPEVLAGRLAARGREDAADRARRLDRAGAPLPEGLRRVIEVDNSGPIEVTVDTVLARLQPESA
ncbi:MAG: phosphonate metabolism protein/1,5-bisphosphokinase (PRPP-forming) PhnN [Antarcticimicrobium sp.]|uniref:phosphonate metabolism protein/1,5-bisphosphokinase (PRPP-forming) PhnN n=1 Tax=Antarcticimicrobium sp. TaxID=2824147 RepID=UPI002617655D|nr:phosphonate metabolism protein/1,5-bisphosphokinase (PRPP-forming) PhnN [Antarcticimicrobium sp.]MDF1715901.1 phosphonate metabolism protein/1,5-bisphosphokinase (PRPP-forming) PhnN [Antarcticimicrobium sp.]